MLKLSWVCLVWLHRSGSFSVDVRYPFTITGPPDLRMGALGESSFGFSIAFYDKYGTSANRPLESGNRTGILVGAPTANDPVNRRTVRPGVVYFCPLSLSRSPEPCERVPVDNDMTGQKVWNYTAVRDHSLLGFTVVVSPKKPSQAMVCAPLWTNAFDRVGSSKFYAPNGMCYRLFQGRNADEWPVPQRLSPFLNFVPTAKDGNRTIQVSTFAQFGFSAHYPKVFAGMDVYAVTVGAPGFWNGVGTTAYSRVSDPIRQPKYPILNSTAVNHFFGQFIDDAHGYVGYSVSSGFLLGHDKRLLYLAGIPRADATGTVVVYHPQRVPTMWSQKQEASQTMEIDFFLRGQQLFEGFGQSVVVLDLNGDGRDDVVVGAPTGHDVHGADQGIIYVFLSDVSWDSVAPTDNITTRIIVSGAGEYGARFGISLADLGDLNNDGFDDFAVGAPFGQSGGFVTILFGGLGGYNPRLTQKIHSTNTVRFPRGFGWALSFDSGGPAFSEPNGRLLAVGDFINEKVHVFRIHHTWKWNLAITLSRNHVILGDLFDRTVLMNVCVHITAGALSSGQTPVIFYLEVNKNASDTNHRSIRAVFAESGNAKLRIPKIMEHSDRIPFCVNNIQINVSDPFDFSYEMIRRPLEISAQVEEIAQLVERNEFCSTCLALSPDSILNRTESLNFVRCENSATGCLPQVTVNFASEKLRSEEHVEVMIIRGLNNSFSIQLEVINSNTFHVFLPRLRVFLPVGMAVQEAEVLEWLEVPGDELECFEDKNATKASGRSVSDHPTTTVCWFSEGAFEVLHPNTTLFLNITLRLVTAETTVEASDPLQVQVVLEHQSLELASNLAIRTMPVNLTVVLRDAFSLRLIPSYERTSLEVKPDFRDDELAGGSETIFRLGYDVVNFGPRHSPVDVPLLVYIPVVFRNISICRITVVEIVVGSHKALCIEQRTDLQLVSGKSFADLEQQQLSAQIDTNGKKTWRMNIKLGCEDPLVQCVTYLCSLPKLLKGEKADITVVAEIGGNHFRSAGKEMFLEVTVLSSAELLSAIATKDGMLLDMTSPEMRSTKVSTTIKAFFGYSEVSLLVIILAVIGGLVFVLIIALILVKTGFFRRGKKDNSERNESCNKLYVDENEGNDSDTELPGQNHASTEVQSIS